MRRDRLLVVRPSPDGRAGVTRLAAGGGAEYSQFADPRYAVLPPEARPCAESLKDVTVRLLPYWYDAIIPDLRTGACVLVVSHGNTLRALIKHLDRLSGEQIAELNIPTGIPLAFDLGPDMHPVIRGGRYLGPQPAGTLRTQGR